MKTGAKRGAQRIAEARSIYGVATDPREVIRITVDLDATLHRRLKIKAAAEGRRLADLVRTWIVANC